MRITVEYMAQVRRVRGLGRETIDVADDATVTTLLETLAQQGETLARMLLDDRGPQRSLLVFVGDEQVDASRGLRDGDTVILLTPMAGGAQG